MTKFNHLLYYIDFSALCSPIIHDNHTVSVNPEAPTATGTEDRETTGSSVGSYAENSVLSSLLTVRIYMRLCTFTLSYPHRSDTAAAYGTVTIMSIDAAKSALSGLLNQYPPGSEMHQVLLQLREVSR